jgi:hypothetical protein
MSMSPAARAKTMLVEYVPSLILVAHGREDPSDSDWFAYVDQLHKSQDYPNFRGVLVTTLGGAPNAGQRKALQPIAAARPFRTCICTDSMVARGVIIAINWLFSMPIHALPYEGVEHALQLLQVPPEERGVVMAAVARMRDQLNDL